MTFHGPWITPDPEPVDFTPTPVYAGVELLDTDFTALCEQTYDDGNVTLIAPRGIWAVDDFAQYSVGQVAFDMGVPSPDPWSPPLPWPPRASGFEVVGDRTLIGAHATVTVVDPANQPSTRQDCHLFLTTNHPADLTYSPTNGGRPGTHFLPGAAVIERDTVSYPGSVTTATLACDVPLTELSDSFGGTVAQYIQLVVGATEQVTHTAPTFVTGAFAGRAWTISTATMTYTYQPPTYRFLFDVLPPLRQYPRDDFLGGAPRQGRVNQSTSVQGSARQGWRATYR